MATHRRPRAVGEHCLNPAPKVDPAPRNGQPKAQVCRTGGVPCEIANSVSSWMVGNTGSLNTQQHKTETPPGTGRAAEQGRASATGSRPGPPATTRSTSNWSGASLEVHDDYMLNTCRRFALEHIVRKALWGAGTATVRPSATQLHEQTATLEVRIQTVGGGRAAWLWLAKFDVRGPWCPNRVQAVACRYLPTVHRSVA